MNYVGQEGQPIRHFPPPHSFLTTSFTTPLRSMVESELLTNIKSWQAGELVLHHKLSVAWRGLTAYAPAEHHVFPCSTSNLPFLPVTTLDGRGRPWTSILAAKDGKPGFTSHSPCKTELEITARLWEGDPLHGFSGSVDDVEAPVSGVGIELRARKSYRKFAGTLVQLTKIGEGGVKLRLRVNQALRYVRSKCGFLIKLIVLNDQALPEIYDYSRPRAPSERRAQRPL